MWDELLRRYHDGELTLDEFATSAAENYQYRDPKARTYPETDGDEDLLDMPSNTTIQAALQDDELTADEAQAIYAALPQPGT